MSQNQVEIKSNTKKFKKKRSLKRHSPVPEPPKNGLAIDMSKPEMDAIFAGLNTGTLENPQEALAQVYGLAIDAVAKTLCDGLCSLCDDLIKAASNPELLLDNPLAPWLAKFMPRDVQNLDAFKQGLSDKIEQSKGKLIDSIKKSMSPGAASESLNMLQQGGQAGASIIKSFVHQVGSLDNVPGCQMHLSRERLEQIFDDIQIPCQADSSRRTYRLTQLPQCYRFSLGKSANDNHHSDDKINECKPCASSDDNLNKLIDEERQNIDPVCISSADAMNERAATESDEILISEIQDNQSEIQDNQSETQDNQSEIQDNQSEIQDISADDFKQTVHETAMKAAECLAPVASNLVGCVTDDFNDVGQEVIGVMQAIAMQIADAVVAAYAEDRQVNIPTLSEVLCHDPRVENNKDLSDFIEELECINDSDNSDSLESLDNEELARAFDLLLENMDE